VTSERQLARGCEDPQTVVSPSDRGRQDERRLGQVRPARQALHLLVGDTFGIEHDGDRVAEVGVVENTST